MKKSKIVNIGKNKKREDVNIIPFLENIFPSSESLVEFSAVPEGGGNRADYYINTENTLIEIKEIHDRESNQKNAQWGKIVTKLQKVVDNNKLLPKVKGTYLVNTPEIFKLSKFDEVSNIVLGAVIKGDKSVQVSNGINFEINKVSNQESIVVFGSIDGAKSIDPANIVYQNIKDKLTKANLQLGNPPPKVSPSKRIVLLVNKYYFPLWDWDLFKSISYTYQDLINYQNIDEIWYQIETKDKGFKHQLLYKKSFFDQFEKSKITTINKEDYDLFANWFSALSEISEENKNKLFIALKEFLKNKKPDSIFKNSQTRQEMVRLGLWLLEKERFGDAIWLIEKFISDNDPSNPDNYKGNNDLNYHLRIVKNEELNVITTVLGHLAWVIQKLAVKQEYIIKAFELTQKLLAHKNYYVVLEGIIPLIEISARRQWLEEYDKKNETNYYDIFKTTAFKLLKKYSKYKAFQDPLTHLFYYYKDLNTNEALTVLRYLEKSRDATALFIYFGIFRERHYKDKIEFDPIPLQKKLINIITKDKIENDELKGGISWNFWRILSDTPEEFNIIKPYLDLFFKQNYSKKYSPNLERIIEDWINNKPDICIPWFINLINKLNSYIKNNKSIARDIWIDTEVPLQCIATHNPSLLINIVDNLIELWKLGAYVGSPKEIFETYKLIKDVKIRNSVVKNYKKWHKEMTKLNPKLQEINWSN